MALFLWSLVWRGKLNQQDNLILCFHTFNIVSEAKNLFVILSAGHASNVNFLE